MFYHWKMCDVIIWIDMFYHWKMWVWCHYLNRHVLWLKNVSVMSLSKQTCIILKSLWLLIISYHALFCCCHLLFWMLSYQQIHPFTWLVEGKWFFFLFFILFFCIVCPTLTVWRLTWFWICHSSNSNMVHSIFNICLWSFHMHIYMGDLGFYSLIWRTFVEFAHNLTQEISGHKA